MMYKKYVPYIITAVVSILLSLKYFPPFDMFFDDKEIFKYTGHVIDRGMVPYQDFFDHKPPLIFFWNYAAHFFGDNGLWFLDTLLVLFASMLFLKVNLKYKLPFPFLLPVLFNLILRHPHLSFGNGMTREYTTIFLLLLFCVIITDHKLKYLQMGLLCALIFFMQQDQVMLALPLVLYAVVKEKPTLLLRNMALALAGALAVTIPIILYFVLNNALDDFWQNAFLFNLNWYTAPEYKPTYIEQLVTLKNKLVGFYLAPVVLLTLLLGLRALWLGSKAPWLLVVSLVCIPLSFISEILSGKMSLGTALVDYYLLPLAASLPITLFVTYAFRKKPILRGNMVQLLIAGLLLFGPVIAIARHSINFHRYPQDYVNRSAEMKYLDADKPGDYQLYVFNNSNYVFAYNKYKIVSPSKWIYHYFWSWYPTWDTDHSITRSIISDLQKYQTKYIINFCEGEVVELNENFKIWRAFLDSSYTQLYPMKLWKRNAGAPVIKQYILPLSKH